MRLVWSCWSRLPLQRKNEDSRGGKQKQAKKEQTNAAQEQVNLAMEMGSAHIEEIVFSANDAGGTHSPDKCNVLNAGNNDAMILYDWLADSATTSHVTNMRDAFIKYTPLRKPVHGVGNAQTHAEGKGTIRIKSMVNGKQYDLTLTDVLYIPTNQQNLLSLGRWDKAGGTYHGGQGKLLMNTRNGATVATGTQVTNHLYWLDNFIIQSPAKTTITDISWKDEPSVFKVTEPTHTWETWHKRFGHLGKSSIQTLFDKNLVVGLNIDLQSPKYDCAACTQAKQHVTSFPKASVEVRTKPGELTHTDLWGKYSMQSIHGNQYFHSFLNDSTRRPSLMFLKHKDKAAQAIKDYVAYLRARGMHPTAFRCDQGAEFVNDELLYWLQEQGIELQTTAPYSPSQNGT